DASVNFFFNTKTSRIVARGAEFEVSAAATPDARMFANYAIAKATLEPIGNPRPDEFNRDKARLADVPMHKVNLGVSYRLSKPLDLLASVVGKWSTGYGSLMLPGKHLPATLPETFVAGSRFVLDTNFVWRASEHTSLELLVTNVLNDTFKLPQGNVPFVPTP